MKPKEKGWLKQYLEFRKELHTSLANDNERGAHPEQSIYKMVQPTGIMYGQSVDALDHPIARDWDEKDRLKVLLAESLISSSLLFYDKPVKDPQELSSVIIKTLESIGNFYNNVFPELSTPTKTFFGRKKSPLDLAEKILDKRIDRSSDFEGNFWGQLFSNSLLFLDVFIFGQWLHTNADRIVSDFFKYEREELRFSVVKVMAASAHANLTIEFEERQLLEFFLQGAELTTERRGEAIKIFEEGIAIEELNLPTNNSWLLKKYFLEMAILTIWSDRNLDEKELQFLKHLCDYLGFSEDDLENSLMAVEGFILEYWEQLKNLQNKHDYNEVSDQFIKRLAHVTEANKGRLLDEVRQSKELLDLIKDAKTKELNEDQKKRIQELLLVTLKTVPTFVVVALPQRYLTLPMLMKILPGDFFSQSLEH